MDNFKSLLKKKYPDKERFEKVDSYLIALDDTLRGLMDENRIKQPVSRQTYIYLFSEVLSDYMTGKSPKEWGEDANQLMETIFNILLELVREFYFPNKKVNKLDDFGFIIQKSGEVLYNEYYLSSANNHTPKKKYDSKVEYGNTSGNIYNGGHYAYKDHCKYGAVSVGGVSGIYKEKAGQKNQKIHTGEVNNLNVVGDLVYFNEYGSLLGGISKVKADGTSYTKIVNDSAIYMFVVGEWIYYLKRVKKGFFSSDFDLYLCKVRTDGTNKTQLTKMGYDFAVWDDHIYYLKGKDVVRMRNDGTECITFIKGSSDDYLSKLYISDGSLYLYKNFSEIYRYNLSTGEQFLVLKDASHHINVSDNRIYYIDNHNKSLYRVSKDGKKRKLLDSLGEISGMHVVGNELIYCKDNTYYTLNI